MPPMKADRFAVASDLHIHRSRCPESWENFTEALKAIRRAGVDHVILAGDTFDCASAFREDADAVRDVLDRAGLWKPGRLTVVVGNHDIFPTLGRASLAEQIAHGLLALLVDDDAQETYESFCGWAGDLIDDDDRLDETDLYPFMKQIGHTVLLANDTTGPSTAYSVNGYWDDEDDENLRRVEPNGLRTVLAIHHPPEASPERDLYQQHKRGLSFGFPRAEYRRLGNFLNDMEVDAVVCGHVHDNGGDSYMWRVTNRTRAFMMGRTGGCDDVERCFGVLEVPERGAVRWKLRPF